jgi:uncharacterized protein YoxC
MSFDDNILLRLRRRYRKDEAFDYVSQELKKAHIEIGVLKSEKQELEDRLCKMSQETQSQKKVIQKLSQKLNDPDVQRQLQKLNKSLSEWRNLALSLKAKYEK